jgi:ABC-type Zn uptake system ZnuABC Zn-binding protein ZnuA
MFSPSFRDVKSRLTSLLLLTTAVSIVACRQSESADKSSLRNDAARNDGIVVATSLPVLGSILEELVLDDDHVSVLMNGQESPHDYQPRASDVRLFARADIIILGDPALDGWASKLGSSDVHYVSSGISLMDKNPHFWLDPTAVSESSVAITDLFCKIRAQLCSEYSTRLTTFQQSLVLLDSTITRSMERLVETPVVTSHPFFDYFLARYQIRSIGTLEPYPGHEASPSDVIKMLNSIGAESPSVLIAQPNLPSGILDLIRQETELNIIYINPLSDTGISYDDYMKNVTSIIASIAA